MPVVAVNVVKVLFVLALYGFLLYVARAIRGHVAGPPPDPTPTPSARRRTRSDEQSPPAPRRVSLRVHPVGDGEPRRVELTSRMVMGRSDAADITIDDEYASDRHVAFEFDGDTTWVEDLDSTNGTRIGDRRIDERTSVGTGTEVLVGRTRVVVQ